MKRYISSSEAKYLTEPRLYEIHEISRKGQEVYTLMMTGKELKDYLQNKRK